METFIKKLNDQLSGCSAFEILSYFITEFDGNLAFGSSLGAEDQVITDMIFKNNLDIKVITLDTGRLFPETYKVYRERHTYY